MTDDLKMDKCFSDPKNQQSDRNWLVRHIETNCVIAAFLDEDDALTKAVECNERLGRNDITYDVVPRPEKG